ncbi:hypothetical protein H1V43_00295 [Streptomyces sp. PSKA54]|uniref:PQQ-binding-like beta-propeller repeat protein n=1 Tax=Streptomyces himalayensis subsp. aureolus TaxID=2758039 RepID=A0A7W2CVS0_9ACTN|nr:hypothetical protein [Streptomyces himalayensis]MBA4859840.1 hypothetical protein [Streptomyces himalayensis subsp. aureolus]
MVLGLLAVPLITAAHLTRPEPYGDHLTVHARVESPGAPEPRLRMTGRAVEAYDPGTGRTRWAYTREGRRPLSVLPVRGHAVTLWSDGLVTDTARRDGRAVRWHRAAPAAAAWLRSPRARDGAGVLQRLAPSSRMLAVVTPYRIAAYRLADGDLRWVLPARRGCAFEPARTMRHGRALLVAQPCRSPGASWTAEVVAVDELGRIVPRRAPLANELPGGSDDRSNAAAGPDVTGARRTTGTVRNNTAAGDG